ncbi:flagellar protein MotY [Celerinatantimonas yamalensis]|uniref:OmpA family protein n=1 Tax=Celerinatantimonas yamalensis TaxID=559956 RepID=A0ABW9G2Q0_9GAMM
MKRRLFICSACLSTFVYASSGLRLYQAPMDDSTWVVSESTPLACQLDHVIPSFGVAHFVSKASRHINLDFSLDMRRLPAITHKVLLRSVPPPWRPGRSAKTVAKLNFYKQFDGRLHDQPAWEMLSELDSGNFPTFYFNDWYSGGGATAVGLSAINFRSHYDKFMQCVSQLLPYSFNDIAFTVLNYKQNSDQLTKESKAKLTMVGNYVKNDPKVDMIVINGYTDSYGGRYPNQKLSESRAKSVKQFFVTKGFDGNKVKVTGYGEKRFIASNQTLLGREKNRRVVISLGKENG